MKAKNRAFLHTLRSLFELVLRKAFLPLGSLGYSFRRMDALTALADRFGSDKGSTGSAHGYTRIYSNRLSHLRNSNLTLVEIGVGRRDAPSLRMWRNYFKAAQIFGFDCEDFSNFGVSGCTIIRGDMSVECDLKRMIAMIGRPIDILIDDGSHASHHQQFALGQLFSSLSSGGIYAIEDMHWTNAVLEKIGATKTRDVLRRFLITGTFESPYISGDRRSYLEHNISTLTLYDSLCTAADATDALAIFVKK